MFTGYAIGGQVHPCFQFYERYQQCFRREALPQKMCTFEAEDFIECQRRDKAQALNYKIHHELKKNKILSLPKYDFKNDKFVEQHNFPSADTYFKNENAAVEQKSA